MSTIGQVIQAESSRNVDACTHRVGRTGRAGASGEATATLDSKSLSIASGLIDLHADAGQSDSMPSWLHRMAHAANARSLEEKRRLQAGSDFIGDSNASDAVIVNDKFA